MFAEACVDCRMRMVVESCSFVAVGSVAVEKLVEMAEVCVEFEMVLRVEKTRMVVESCYFVPVEII